MVISGVADAVPDRIAHLVYLDAVVPQSGESMLDVVGEPVAGQLRSRVRAHGEGWLEPGIVGSGREKGLTDPADIAWVERMRTPQPYATYSDALRLEGRASGLSTTYIR